MQTRGELLAKKAAAAKAAEEAAAKTGAKTPPKTSAEERTLPLLPDKDAGLDVVYQCTICEEEFPLGEATIRPDGKGIECLTCAGPSEPKVAAEKAPTPPQEPSKAAKGLGKPSSAEKPTGPQVDAAVAIVDQKHLEKALTERQVASQVGKKPLEMRIETDAVTGVRKVFLPWGKARMPMDRFNSFECGGHSITIEVGPEENLTDACVLAIGELKGMADTLFDAQYKWYRAKLDGGKLHKD